MLATLAEKVAQRSAVFSVVAIWRRKIEVPHSGGDVGRGYSADKVVTVIETYPKYRVRRQLGQAGRVWKDRVDLESGGQIWRPVMVLFNWLLLLEARGDDQS